MSKITSKDCVAAIKASGCESGLTARGAEGYTWRRVSKRKDEQGRVVRVFKNEDGDFVKVTEYCGACIVEPATCKEVDIIFVVKEDEEPCLCGEKAIRVCATTLEYFKREGACDDVGYAGPFMPPWCDECCEGLFEVDLEGATVADVRAKLLEFGLKENEAFTEFLAGCDW